MKITFILTQFGTPHSWTDKYLDQLIKFQQYGFYWKIFTPNKIQSRSNVEIIPMNIMQLNQVMERTIGVNPNCYMLPNGLPNKPMSDFYIASGEIFQDYLKDSDYWGITNWDVVYGRIDKVISNDMDIYSDDPNTINGVFSLFRNVKAVNTLYGNIDNWQEMFKDSKIYGMDEIHLTEIVRKFDSRALKFYTPVYYPLHGHDRLEIHRPVPKLKLMDDGSLWELIADIGGPKWIHSRPFIGREILYFHFNQTKQWPILQ